MLNNTCYGGGQLVYGLVGSRQDLGFYLERGESPEGLWAEERLHLTRAHRLPLAVAVGGQAMGGRQEPGWAVYIIANDSGGGGAA